MKYAQLIMGLFAGVAIGGSVVASTGKTMSGSALDADAVKKIVREVIAEEPALIMDSVQKFQDGEQSKKIQGASEALKDKAFRDQVYNDVGIGSVGPKDSKRVIVEFFDYNCPACKMQYKEIDALVKKDKTVRVLFREYPIFGEVSETNSRLGIAVVRIAPEKYFAFYEKMHSHKGRISESDALGFIKELGIDVEKAKTEAAKPETAAAIEANRKIGEALHIQGTPTLIVGDEVIPHAAGADEIIGKLK
jgi:protein-disulfide isomerase